MAVASNLGSGKEFFCSPKRPAWQWGVKLTTHLHLLPEVRNEWSHTSILPSLFMEKHDTDLQHWLQLLSE